MSENRNPNYVSLPTMLVAIFVGDYIARHAEAAGAGLTATAVTYAAATGLGVVFKRILFNAQDRELRPRNRSNHMHVTRLPQAGSARAFGTAPATRYRRTFT